MAFGYSAALPLQQNKEDGFYVLTKTIIQNTKQNFKNLLLTVPGERVMIPDFGVGLKRYLFENNSFELQDKISSNIHDQVESYMPFVSINQVEFLEENDDLGVNIKNILSIRVFYSIPSQGISDVIAISKTNIA